MTDHSPKTLPLQCGPSAASSDEELVRFLVGGDEGAWALLLERYTNLIYRKALDYGGRTLEREDEAADLYLFMAELLRKSLGSFQGRCQVKTWIVSVVGNRRHVLKAFLLKKDPGRADVRLPRALQGSPPVDQEIYRRLVWGLEADQVAVELGVSASRCEEVEALVARSSPRVYARIRANRVAQATKVSLDDGDEESDGRPRLQVAGRGPDPLDELLQRELEALLRQGLEAAYSEMDRVERRVLALMYNQGFTAARVVAAAREGDLGLTDMDGTNRCYYVKDRALARLVDHIVAELARAGHASVERPGNRELLQQVEALLAEIGVPEDRT